METLKLDNSGNDNPWRLVLTGLKPHNVDEIYNRELTRWRVFHSDSKRLDGKELSFDEFMLMFIGNGFENLDPNRFEINNESEGFPLKEETFIKEKIVKYEYILKDTEGSALDRAVYLKCELFLDYLKKRLVALKKSPGSPSEKKRKDVEYTREDPVLKLNQIALLIYYEGGGVSRDNASATAEEYGWCSKTSGHKLYQYFNKLRENTERVGDPGSKVKLKNKIKLLESVLDHLSDVATQQAKKEIDHLKRLFKDQYE